MSVSTRRATEFVIELINRPGELGKLAQVLGKEHVNILGIGAVAHGDIAVAHLVTDEPASTQTTLEGSGYTMEVREVLLLEVPDEPGALGRVANTLGTAGVNIEATYVTTGGTGERVELAISTDDAEAAEEAMAGL